MKVNKPLQTKSKYQRKLITLIATLEYINKNKKNRINLIFFIALIAT
ncbi:hypothetical protein QIA45_05200 (plasmid) [Borreliella andersonii]|uniref:Uncharacterized protein n=1 Tax=Borrelia andersonii TaxID=42109 RepID=A0ACD5G673_BORAD